MAQPRFLFAAPAGAVAGPDGLVAWRLVGGNNHVLGRAPEPCDGLDACIDAVLRLQANVGLSDTEVTRVDGTPTWSWNVSLNGDQVATAARHHRREREAEAALAHFVEAVPLATLSDHVDARPPRRELLRPDFVLPHLLPVDDELGEPLDPSITQDLPKDVVLEAGDVLREADALEAGEPAEAS